MKYPIRLNWVVSMLMCFSIGCLFGVGYPDKPFMIWVGVIFVGACMKIWLYHQSDKIREP
jgi:hypothetical protein